LGSNTPRTGSVSFKPETDGALTFAKQKTKAGERANPRKIQNQNLDLEL
jgi:hypothetical protein